LSIIPSLKPFYRNEVGILKIVDIIKYEGDNSTFVWKHPCEDFNTSSQLIVHESQEALFYMNGQALDLFGPGMKRWREPTSHTLFLFIRTISGKIFPSQHFAHAFFVPQQQALKYNPL